MPKATLTEVEQKVLTAFAAEPDAWLNWYYHTVVAAAGDGDVAEATCRGLRRRKLLDGQGRGKFAQYGINDKGKAALDG